MKAPYISPLETHELNVQTRRPPGSTCARASEPIPLRLRRYCVPGGAQKQRVLLLHGANTNGDAFTMSNGLAAYLRDERAADVWVLDWRGSSHVVRQLLDQKRQPRPLFGSAADERAAFSIDRVADEDIPAALEKIVEVTRNDSPISVIGFCVGGGALALAVARDHVTRPRVQRIVLMTLGLFYNVPWDGWIKSQEHLLEVVIDRSPGSRAIDPFRPQDWPGPLAEVYKSWPSSWFAQEQEETFKRLTFMYGEPFSPPALARLPPLEELFGPLHLGLYMQAVQWVRDGFPPDLEPNGGDPFALQEKFGALDVTLVTGAQNRLWHRESIDLMYEWLRRCPRARGAEQRCRKMIFNDYAHLDMLWAGNAATKVFGPLATAAGA